MEDRVKVFAPVVPFAVLAAVAMVEAVKCYLSLYSSPYNNVLPMVLVGLLMSILPLLTGLAAGRRSFVLHPAGLLVFAILVVLWLTSGHIRELFVRIPDKFNMRASMIDVQLPLALLAAVSLGLSFSVADEPRPFSWRRETPWVMAFAAAGATAWALSTLLNSVSYHYIYLVDLLVRLFILTLSGVMVALLLPASTLRRPAAITLIAVGVILFGIRYGVSVIQIMQPHTDGNSSAGLWGTLYRWCTLLLIGDNQWFKWYASSNLLYGLIPILLVWPLRSLLRRGPAASVAKPI